MSYESNRRTRKDIDIILEKIQSIQSNMGVDSTLDEIERFKSSQLMLWYEIKALDEEFYNTAFLIG